MINCFYKLFFFARKRDLQCLPSVCSPSLFANDYVSATIVDYSFCFVFHNCLEISSGHKDGQKLAHKILVFVQKLSSVIWEETYDFDKAKKSPQSNETQLETGDVK